MISSTFWIAVSTVRELIYEKVFYLLLGFAFFTLAMGAMLSQMTYTDVAKITVDLGLASIEIAMTLFAIFVSIFLFQRETHHGSIFLVLSKPVSRASFLTGKYIGQCFIQCFVVLIMGSLISLVLLSEASFVVKLAFWQALGFITAQISIVTAMAYLFAVLAGPVTAAVATLGLFVLGQSMTLIEGYLKSSDAIVPSILHFLKGLVPRLELLNIKSYAAYGVLLENSTLAWGISYALVSMLFFLVFACVCFNRKDIMG